MDTLVILGGILFLVLIARRCYTDALLLGALVFVIAALPGLHSCAQVHRFYL